MREMGLIPGLGRSPGEVKGYPLQYSDLENSTDYIVHGVAKSRTRLSDFHFLSCGTQLRPLKSSQQSVPGGTPTDPKIFLVQRYSKWGKKASNGNLSNMSGISFTNRLAENENEFLTTLELSSIASHFSASLSIAS